MPTDYTQYFHKTKKLNNVQKDKELVAANHAVAVADVFNPCFRCADSGGEMGILYWL